MGKKVKIGKQRRDKYYHLAKEAGYRSRAAFKLIQLNKRFEFLQKSRALVDLCAAPGGWLQVAAENMPISSIRIGVDLVPIKAVRNCITLQGDITIQKTREEIKKQLHDWKVDCVLHDGAPNVGQNWARDAFDQNCLTLSALKLATQVLNQNGTFVTKIFRSADHGALVKVFQQLFKKVNVWKPTASRLESAEIFVVCEKYSAPAKVDPDLLDPKKVFIQAEPQQQSDVNMIRMLSGKGKLKKSKAVGYADGDLTLYHELNASDFVNSSDPLTLLAKASTLVLDDEKYRDSKYTTSEFMECIRDIRVCGATELRKIVNWRKRMVELKQKETKEEEKAMAVEEDPETVEERELAEIDELIRNASAAEKAKLKKQKRLMLQNKRRLQERKQLGMHHEGDRIDEAADFDLFKLGELKKTLKRRQAMDEAYEKARKSLRKDERLNGDEKLEEEIKVSTEEAVEYEDKRVTKRNGTNNVDAEKDDDDDESSDEDVVEEEMKSSPTRPPQKLTPLQLAMGEKMIHSSKTRSELEDWGWNRYANNDTGLPDWFVEDEDKHCRPDLPVAKDRLMYYKNRERSLNARPIKAVVEAKQRKKRRQLRRLESAKKRAEGLLENGNLEQSEKIREVRKLYKKALRPEQRKITYVPMTKGRRGSVSKPTGGRYKVVDHRMKKDTRSQKRAEARKGGPKRRPPPSQRNREKNSDKGSDAPSKSPGGKKSARGSKSRGVSKRRSGPAKAGRGGRRK